MRVLLGALWQSDTAFPSGGFAFSNGVEAAVATLGVLDRAALTSLIGAALVRRWAKAERPAILYAFHAASLHRLGAVDAAYEAATLSEPLRLGSRRNGRTLLKAHQRLGSPGAAELGEAIAQGLCLGHLPAAQGWIWRRCGLGEAEAVAVSGYSTAAAMANAAVRLGALGVLEAQAALTACLPLIEEFGSASLDPSGPIVLSSATPWLDIVSARHARADLRLFAN